MNTVIFAGSGFSKAIFDQKIQSELLDDFINAPESTQYVSHLPEELINLVDAIPDIELIMSHYLHLGYSGLPHKPGRSREHQRVIVFFRMALAIYFRDKFLRTGYHYYEQETKYLIEEYFNCLDINPEKLSLVTTNYDLGFERIVDDVFGKNKYYYPGFDKSTPRTSKIPIMKLHGSINWLEERGPLNRPGFMNSSRYKFRKDILDELTVHPLTEQREFTLQANELKYTPIMVPFFLQKSQWEQINSQWWRKPFTDIWRKTFECLTKADRIFFWGYGLPAADYHMFSFLLTALRKSNANCEVVDYLSVDDESNLMKLIKMVYGEESDKINLWKDGLKDFLSFEVET